MDETSNLANQADARRRQSVPSDRIDRPYRSAAGLTKALLVLLAVGLFVDVIAAISDLSELRLLTRVQEGQFITAQEAESNDLRQGIIGLTQTAVLLIAAIVFIVWFHRLYKNISSLAMAPLRYGTGWAIGGWFVPIWTLFRPKQIMNDIWRASDDEDGYRPGSFEGRPVHPLIDIWWAMFLVSSWIGRIALRSLFQEDTIEDFIASSRAFLAADSFDVLLSAITIAVVVKVASRQRTHAAQVLGDGNERR